MALLGRKKGDAAPDGTMSLMEHLYELRRRLFYAVLAIFVGTVLGFIWFTTAIPVLNIPTLGVILTNPYCAVPSPPRWAQADGGCSLLASTPFSILQIRLKAALMAGLVFSGPFWLYQLWAFITPALYSKERRFAVIFTSAAALLLAGGAVLAYWVVGQGLTVLLGFGGDIAQAALDPDKYFTFLMAMLLIFGVSFELPLLLVMLNIIGVLSGEKLAKARRYSFFGLFVFAALVVPGNDPITMTALAVALCILYEVAVQIAKLHDRRKGKRLAAEGFGDLADDEASPLVTASADPTAGSSSAAATSPLDQTQPVSASGPIEASGPVEPVKRRHVSDGLDDVT